MGGVSTPQSHPMLLKTTRIERVCAIFNMEQKLHRIFLYFIFYKCICNPNSFTIAISVVPDKSYAWVTCGVKIKLIKLAT